MNRIKSAALTGLTGLAATTPLHAQSYDCVLDRLCIGHDCQSVNIDIELTINDDEARFGPIDDALHLSALPDQGAAADSNSGRRGFYGYEGNDRFFLTLGGALDVTVTSHLVNAAYRHAAMTGQCQEAR